MLLECDGSLHAMVQASHRRSALRNIAVGGIQSVSDLSPQDLSLQRLAIGQGTQQQGSGSVHRMAGEQAEALHEVRLNLQRLWADSSAIVHRACVKTCTSAGIQTCGTGLAIRLRLYGHPQVQSLSQALETGLHGASWRRYIRLSV